MAPYSAQCLQGGTGPCELNSIELGGQSMQILEFDSDMTRPRLVPIIAAGQDVEQFQGIVDRWLMDRRLHRMIRES